jgi:hypothetical protein
LQDRIVLHGEDDRVERAEVVAALEAILARLKD